MRKFILIQRRDILCECKGSIYITNVPENEDVKVICMDNGVDDFNLGVYDPHSAEVALQQIIAFLNRKGTLNDAVFSMPKQYDFAKKGADSDE